jgi:hypothetical protein
MKFTLVDGAEYDGDDSEYHLTREEAIPIVVLYMPQGCYRP